MLHISDEYRQITIKDEPYRVTPLGYASFIRWLNKLSLLKQMKTISCLILLLTKTNKDYLEMSNLLLTAV